MLVLRSQSLMYQLFHWKSFVIIDQSTKTGKLFHCLPVCDLQYTVAYRLSYGVIATSLACL